jgi:hypothetical protein
MHPFYSENFIDRGSLTYAIARKGRNEYHLIFSRAYGMAATRDWGVLNSTTASKSISLSSDGRPCIWMDAEVDRDPRNISPSPGGLLLALSTAEPKAIIKETGKMREIQGRMISEVEILLSEEELGYGCIYCGSFELQEDSERFANVRGEGYESEHMCFTVCRICHLLQTGFT